MIIHVNHESYHNIRRHDRNMFVCHIVWFLTAIYHCTFMDLLEVILAVNGHWLFVQ